MQDLTLYNIYNYIIRSWSLDDAAKALYPISSDVVLGEKSHYDFLPVICDWPNFYLTNRFLTISIDNVLSSDHSVTRGVSQASILAPFLPSQYHPEITEGLTQRRVDILSRNNEWRMTNWGRSKSLKKGYSGTTLQSHGKTEQPPVDIGQLVYCIQWINLWKRSW